MRRKNSLFGGSKDRGNRIAMIYSLLACWREYNIDLNIYFEDVFSRIDSDITKCVISKNFYHNALGRRRFWNIFPLIEGYNKNGHKNYAFVKEYEDGSVRFCGLSDNSDILKHIIK